MRVDCSKCKCKETSSSSASSASSASSFQNRLRRPKCKRHEESCVACLTQFPPEEAAIASAWLFNREGRKRQPVPTSWLDSRCNSLSPCRPGITRRCNTPPLSLLMNNRTREIVRDARGRVICKDLRLDSRYRILFRLYYRHDALLKYFESVLLKMASELL